MVAAKLECVCVSSWWCENSVWTKAVFVLGYSLVTSNTASVRNVNTGLTKTVSVGRQLLSSQGIAYVFPIEGNRYLQKYLNIN